jgi:hypothetical protein
MELTFKPRCAACGRIYLRGQGGWCEVCLRRREGVTLRSNRREKIRCDCGRPAVEILLVAVIHPDGGFPDIQDMPLCRDCLELEREMWRD